MRLELNTDVLLLCTVLLVVSSWLFAKFSQSKKRLIITVSFFGALLMPEFTPGHGEFVMLLPTAALFFIPSGFTWVIGLFFVLVNFSILLITLNWLSHKK